MDEVKVYHPDQTASFHGWVKRNFYTILLYLDPKNADPAERLQVIDTNLPEEILGDGFSIIDEVDDPTFADGEFRVRHLNDGNYTIFHDLIDIQFTLSNVTAHARSQVNEQNMIDLFVTKDETDPGAGQTNMVGRMQINIPIQSIVEIPEE